MPARNALVQLLALYYKPWESQCIASQTDGQTDRRTTEWCQ